VQKETSIVLKGDICYSIDSESVNSVSGGYLVCIDGICQGVFDELPEQYAALQIHDYQHSLIIPGMTDLHVHAPQYSFCGLGMDMELLEWLDTQTFPEEARYADLEYARKAYQTFTDDLTHSVTTRACIFATCHLKATEILMDQMEQSGLITKIGKVNMDRNAPSYLCEESAEASIKDTLRWLNETSGRYQRTEPILTPRFIPSCTDELMTKLSQIRREWNLSVQSHLSENMSEVDWVKNLVPDASGYADAYDRVGMFGGDYPAIMAHCIYVTKEEQNLMKQNGVYVAHCPSSNTNLSSGIAPIRRYLNEGLKVGLATDLAGGHSISMLQMIVNAISVSKLRFRLIDEKEKPLRFTEAFYLATIGGGSFFGKVGSFDPDYEMDAVIIDDSELCKLNQYNIQQRLERSAYLESKIKIQAKYVAGRQLVI